MLLRTEARVLMRLAWPVVLTQIATVTMGIVDTLMVARLGTNALAAVSLGHAWVFGGLVLAIGLIMGLDPIVSQAHGAGDGDRAGLALQRGLLLAVVASIPITLAWLVTGPGLVLLGQDPALAAEAHAYAVVQIPSIAPMLMFTALRHYLGGRTIVAPAMWVGVAANVLNLVANWVLIFGHLGFAARGVVGAGIATALSRVFMFVALAALSVLLGLHKGAWPPWSRAVFSPRGIAEVVGYGIPVAIQLGLEVWCFHIVTLLAGLIDAAALAAHMITLRIVSFTFMVPFGLSIAAAVRVGNLIGAGRPIEAQRAARVAFLLSAGAMTLLSVTVLVLRRQLPELWVSNPDVLDVAVSIMPVAAALQLFDGTQVVGCGILRGMGDTRPAALFNLFGYYALALPFGAWLAFSRDRGVEGLWWGLCLGLATIAVLLVWRIERRGPAFRRLPA